MRYKYQDNYRELQRISLSRPTPPHTAIPIFIFLDNLDLFAEDHTGCKLFGPVTKILALLRSINSIKPDLVLGVVLENCDGITISHPDNFARDGLGVDTANQKDKI